jgi:methionine salvage enolase-phosphatase E1
MNYHNILKTKIISMITNDLTIGRIDNDLIPFTCNEIDNFIDNNNDNIEKVIQNMITEYSNDNEIELLADPLLDWIGEYLYDLVDTKIDI